MTCGADTFVKIFETENLNAEPRTLEHHDAAITTLAVNSKVGGCPPPTAFAARDSRSSRAAGHQLRDGH